MRRFRRSTTIPILLSRSSPAIASQAMDLAFESLEVLLLSLCCLFLVPSAAGWACRDTCGNLQVKYPFGTGPGCGDPRFQNSVSCVNQKLMFTTHSGSYPISSIDYSQTTIYLADPQMSTCAAMTSSGSFGLDAAAPFKFKNDIFVLLNCSLSSCLYSPTNYLCDTGSSQICSSLYTCPGVLGLGLQQYSPISTCCVYAPINLGSAAEINLAKLQCQSYTSIYSFGDDATDPTRWNYGIALKYSFNLDNSNFPTACVTCEQSKGVCGFTGMYNSFTCVCRNGVNTTTNCNGQEYYWSRAQSHRSAAFGLWIAGIVLAIVSSFCL